MITAILIDDEVNSRNALQKKIKTNCPAIQIVAECSDAEEGIAAIEKYQPQVVFLDVEMPRMNGFGMLEKIENKNFNIVFTTAYNQYAINAIKFGAFDYLVKPIDVEELIIVAKKLNEQKQVLNNSERLDILLNQISPANKSSVQKIAIATQAGLEFIPIDTIIYLEAIGNYTELHFTDGKKLMASKTLKEFEDLLEHHAFFRIHNASLVNLIFVKKYIKGDGGQIQLTNNITLDVARRRKEELLQLLLTLSKKV
jgi:two-component system, LytTR family, response regulator